MVSLDVYRVQSTFPRDPDGVGISVIRQAPGDVIIPARLDLVEDRIAGLWSDPVL